MVSFLDHISKIPPHRPAVWDDGRALTFGELLLEAQILAPGIEFSYPEAQYILFEAQRSVEFVVQLFAIWEAGKVPVPVDPDAPQALREMLLSKCQSSAFVQLEDWSNVSNVPFDSSPNNKVRPADEALIVFTSGTSGEPKGVVVSQSNLYNSSAVISEYLEYAQYNSAAVILPLHYSYALISQLLAMLYSGGGCYIAANMRNPLKLSAAIERSSVRSLCAVPSSFQALIRFRKMGELSFPSIQVLCSAGAKLDRSLIEDIRILFPNATIFDNYGMTEATPRVTYLRDDDERFGDGTCGKAIRGMELRILDQETLQPMRDGEIGCVAVRGPSVMPGYLNDDAKNAMCFTKDGFFISGDLAYLEGGYLYVCGRADEVFNVGGEKVSPLEVEAALYKFPGIEDCAVAAIDDSARGAIPAAFLLTAEKLKKSVIVAHLRNHLPSTKIPVRYYIVESLPKTSNGKIQRTKLDADARYVLGKLK